MSANARKLALVLLGASLMGCGGRRDVVIITLDTVRADRLSCYGHAGELTPNLDRLAREGVLFEDASCATPITLPSHATLFTGRYPSATGVRNNGSFVVSSSETTLAEVLHEAGWSTAAVIAAFPLESRYGLAQGFDLYDEELPPVAIGERQAFSVHFSERDAHAVTERALSIWARPAPHPRFLWVHYFDAHAPYAAPEPYATAHAGAPYEAEIAYVDAEVGRLLHRIELDSPRAVVVVASDHGESLGEHGEKTHGVFLYQSTMHVPLLVRAPGLWPAGRRIADPVTLADVLPSVLGLVGAAAPRAIDGADLGPLVAGKSAPTREVYGESYLPLIQFRFSPLTMLRSGPLKYIDAPIAELYDVRRDPEERHSLVDSEPARAGLARRLAELASLEDPEATLRAAGGLDSEAEARLRSLGYAAAGVLAPGGTRGRDPKAMTGYLQRYDRAVGLVAAGSPEAGLRELQGLLEEAPENYMARYQLAAGLMTLGRNEEARAQLEEVVQAAPEFGNGELMLALALDALGRLDDAVVHFDAAAVLLPTQAEPRLAEGRALEARGRFDAAADAYRQAIEREPNADAPPRALLALLYGRGELTRASAELRSYTGRFPKSAALWVVLGESLRREGDRSGAAGAVRRARALDASRLDAQSLEADLALDAGNAAEADRIYRAILATRPEHRAAAMGLGRALAAGGSALEAETWIVGLAERYPEDSAPLVMRGVLAERHGDRAAALSFYREALLRSPSDRDAQRGISRIEQGR